MKITDLRTQQPPGGGLTTGTPSGGDLDGPLPTPDVVGIGGYPIDSVGSLPDPVVLVFDGDSWVPTDPATISTLPSGPAGGDLTGTYPDPDVASLQGVDITAAGTPAADDLLVATGPTAAVWGPLSAGQLSSRWEPLANGDPVTPELVFAAGDVIMVEVF